MSWPRLFCPYLECDLPVDVDHVVVLREDVREEQRRHLAHQDVAELLGNGHLRADLLRGDLEENTIASIHRPFSFFSRLVSPFS